MHQPGTPSQMPGILIGKTLQKLQKKGTFRTSMQTKRKQSTQSTHVTEGESEAIGGESYESETNMHRNERTNRITHKKCLIAVVKINSIEMEFILDTGSPISITPVDENMMKQAAIQKVKQRHLARHVRVSFGYVVAIRRRRACLGMPKETVGVDVGIWASG